MWGWEDPTDPGHSVGQVAFSVGLVGEFAFYAYCLKVIPGESQRLTALVQSSQLGAILCKTIPSWSAYQAGFSVLKCPCAYLKSHLRWNDPDSSWFIDILRWVDMANQ